jgi:hypothetical protein
MSSVLWIQKGWQPLSKQATVTNNFLKLKKKEKDSRGRIRRWCFFLQIISLFLLKTII